MPPTGEEARPDGEAGGRKEEKSDIVIKVERYVPAQMVKK